MTARSCAAVVLAILTGAAIGQGWPDARAAGLAAPPHRLADTGLYAAGQTNVVDARNRPFAPQYPLWTDGLAKQRWIHIPEGMAIDARDPYDWQFPIGTKLWKEFSLAGRRLETRLLWKASDSGWVAATYAWSEDGTTALLAPDEGVWGVAELAKGRHHRIPARADCAACHGPRLAPLGFNALQLSTDRDPLALHAEPLRTGMITLETLARERLLQGAPHDLVTSPPRIRTASAETRAVLGYLAANCGACHNGSGEISAVAPTLALRDLLENGDAVARQLVRHRTRWQVPGVPDGESVLVRPGDPDGSALLVRLRSRAPSSQMPPLGTVLRDQAAVDAVTNWIAHGVGEP